MTAAWLEFEVFAEIATDSAMELLGAECPWCSSSVIEYRAHDDAEMITLSLSPISSSSSIEFSASLTERRGPGCMSQRVIADIEDRTVRRTTSIMHDAIINRLRLY